MHFFIYACVCVCVLFGPVFTGGHSHTCVYYEHAYMDLLWWSTALIFLPPAPLQSTTSEYKFCSSVSLRHSVSPPPPPPPPLLISYTAHHAPQRPGNNYISTIQLTVCLICEFMLRVFSFIFACTWRARWNGGKIDLGRDFFAKSNNLHLVCLSKCIYRFSRWQQTVSLQHYIISYSA